MWGDPTGVKVIEAAEQVENQWDWLPQSISTTGQTQALLIDMFTVEECLTVELAGWTHTAPLGCDGSTYFPGFRTVSFLFLFLNFWDPAWHAWWWIFTVIYYLIMLAWFSTNGRVQATLTVTAGPRNWNRQGNESPATVPLFNIFTSPLIKQELLRRPKLITPLLAGLWGRRGD